MIRIPAFGRDRAPYIPNHVFHSQDNGDLVFAPDSMFVDFYKQQQGQICRGSPFGEEIYKLSASGPRLWLEIGTWNGLGTTKCILDGFRDRNDDPRLISIELDHVLFNAAEQNLHAHPVRRYVDFRQGCLKSRDTIPFPDESTLSSDDRNCPHFFIHYEREKALYESASSVCPDFAPEVAVLDGGEYSGILDWFYLDKSNLQYLCLDDTHTFKNREVIKKLDPKWRLLTSGNDRNGWAIYKNGP